MSALPPVDLGRAVETGTGSLGLSLPRRAAAEFLGTAMLLVAVVGSGIMATRLSAGDAGLQLLENAIATAGALVGLILMFGAVSGAHFNPAVTILDLLSGSVRMRDAGAYIAAQVAGACAGTILANVMFELPAISRATTERSSPALWLSEVVATVALLLVIQGCVRSGRANVVPFAVGAWIGGAYWFTSSTSFANPAVTIGRSLSDSFTGIAPGSVPGFLVAQCIGVVLAYVPVRAFYPQREVERNG